MPDAFVYFALTPDGKVREVRMAISPLTDFSFDFQDLLLTLESGDSGFVIRNCRADAPCAFLWEGLQPRRLTGKASGLKPLPQAH